MPVARGKKEDCKVSEGRALLADPQVQRVNALVTAVPLHNKQDRVRVISFEQGKPLTYFFELCHRHPHHALWLILKASPVP